MLMRKRHVTYCVKKKKRQKLVIQDFQMILSSIRDAECALFVSEGVFHFINQVCGTHFEYVSEFIAADE